jgi:hypothetical protein
MLGCLQAIVFLNPLSNRRPEKCSFGEIKRVNLIHGLGFTPLSCDYNLILQEFSELISTVLLEKHAKNRYLR